MKAEILHIKLQKVYSFDNEETDNTEFQKWDEATILSNGGVFDRDFIAPFDCQNDAFFKIEANYNNNQYRDFKVARSEMKTAALNFGYNNIVKEQASLLTKWGCIPYDTSIKFLTPEEIISLCYFFDKSSKTARELRSNAMFVFLRNTVPLTELFVIIPKAETLLVNYIKYGIEGTSEKNIDGVSDVTGLFDYIQSTSSFVGAGFIEENINPMNGYSKQSLCDRCLDILKNGNY